ncbi:LytTR family two component transcriptional regulator [Mucilaginibacter frigoritolerans]|jgi:two-component system, LytTR family, response regulator|uniref:LytTR family two component transcriptional regulator n=1 Tax=Mucilaginibacter frigoritolerans TaxID=652788 RepID=A0A562UC33_9SPHI|nr:LytTR family DNA-binding domain-containing protein [Mucilaginibacter frigoritolerans]TWJ03374.1 LytTR family two component transcriptional regulator [Mucilaginibacter frigoritolerans]
MKIKCIAIDDEPLALRLISGYISRFPFLELVGTFENAMAGAEFLKHNPVDLLFIDILMPDVMGTELVRSLKNKPMVIFATAHKNFAYESYELAAMDYLLKPIDLKRFTKAVEKAQDYYKYKNGLDNETEGESLFVYAEYRMVKINLRDVEYIESMEAYIKIHTIESKPVITLMPLKKVLEKLPDKSFKQIHRSYVVNIQKIRSIQNRRVQLTVAELPVSDTYIESLRNALNK